MGKPLGALSLAALLVGLLGIRVAYGLYTQPTQPIIDEIQTCLIGLKYYSTHAWPYYGNDLVNPGAHDVLLSQDPGALEGLAIGLPLRFWPNPIAAFLLLNLASWAGLCFFGYYVHKRLPRLPLAFTLLWPLLIPWTLHFSTTLMNTDLSLPLACVFFIGWLEATPEWTVGWLSPAWANALMGFGLSGWVQLHRNFVLVAPLLLFSFWSQWRKGDRGSFALNFTFGVLPLAVLWVPTVLWANYHMGRDVDGFSYGFNPLNAKKLFVILAQYLSLVSFELPRFIGQHTAERWHYLASEPYLWPGFFLWYFGLLQVLIWFGALFDNKNPNPHWDKMRWLLVLSFTLVFGALVMTQKTPEPNTYFEMLPIPLLFSFYVWDRSLSFYWGKPFLWFFLTMALIFSVGYPFNPVPKDQSVYTEFHDQFTAAVDKKDYHQLGERRSGAFY